MNIVSLSQTHRCSHLVTLSRELNVQNFLLYFMVQPYPPFNIFLRQRKVSDVTLDLSDDIIDLDLFCSIKNLTKIHFISVPLLSSVRSYRCSSVRFLSRPLNLYLSGSDPQAPLSALSCLSLNFIGHPEPTILLLVGIETFLFESFVCTFTVILTLRLNFKQLIRNLKISRS